MAQSGLIVRALIASPGDVYKERQAIPEVIAMWNATHSFRRGIIIEPVKWESHSVPGLEGRPQAMINKQLVEVCDLLIGVFWTRLGTPTGVAPSGTVEEIGEFCKAEKPVLLYFSSQPVVPDTIDLDQYTSLKKFRAEMEPKGLVESYSDVAELREKLTRHLTSVIDRMVESGVVNTHAVSSHEPQEVDLLAGYNLSAEAKKLLVTAATADGIVMYLRSSSGCNTQAGQQILNEPHNPRSEATWEQAIKNLLAYDLLTARGYKWQVFEVSAKGYEIADLLRQRGEG